MDEDSHPGLFEELERRKVFRAATACVAAATIILLGADLLTTMLAIGSFPLAMWLASAHELTPGSVCGTEAGAGSQAFRAARLVAELGVGSGVEGSVHLGAGRARVAVQLTDSVS